MKHILLTIIYVLYTTSYCIAQIGVNTDNPSSSSVLDINAYNNDKGLLIPRMTTSQKLAIASPASGLTVYDTDYKCVSQYKDTPANPGTFSWSCLTLYNRHFLYMPSVNIPTSDGSGSLLTGTQTLDLYNIYYTGFNTPKVKSTSAPVRISYFNNSQLNYYVTYCDPCITITGISNTGVLSYTVNTLPNYDAFVNIIFTLR
ncbi:hypothetical protein [Dysgonomonas macrotermitis]|uniref:Uncharacterized protein n=1 Tax=Dysgonomonas macrotermitis TaxID=1346286 RepID=A0A1M4YVB2_9BACT|nr:hypothetical protein [Dysgonomonas macrotermitis]SHF09286.1 hypothetical protein SAMN05444362_103270 [Dysgonomonas macrotermitis]